MSQPASNIRLRSARHAAGYRSQQELATALGVGVRQVRRWESENPPWPHPDLQQALTELLGQDMESLGFTLRLAATGPTPCGAHWSVPPWPLSDWRLCRCRPQLPCSPRPLQQTLRR